jgi:hypothetical protein
MDGLKNYREKIKSIEALVAKMESGELSINELLELEKLTRDLHERSIILKYKAFENRNSEFPVEEEVLTEEELEAIDEVEEEIDLFEEEAEEEEAPALDFSLFDAPEEEEETKEPIIEFSEPVEEQKPIHQIHITETPIAEEPVIEKSEPKVVEPTPAPTPNPVVEEPKAVIKENGSSFLDRLKIIDNSIGSQIAGRKIETLTGAFGINDRLLYINELFDGSGEAFSDAIKLLDSQPGLDAASMKIEELAFKNSWNPEEETVLEFLSIIKRRYA